VFDRAASAFQSEAAVDEQVGGAAAQRVTSTRLLIGRLRDTHLRLGDGHGSAAASCAGSGGHERRMTCPHLSVGVRDDAGAIGPRTSHLRVRPGPGPTAKYVELFELEVVIAEMQKLF
jgi:hypothetical protein